MPARPSVPPCHAIQRIGYEPAPSNELDLEIFSFRSLASRVRAHELSGAHLIQFHELICMTRGECRHVIDFDPIDCVRGVLERMHEDARIGGSPPEVNALLRHQLCALLLRLARAQRRQEESRPAVAPVELQRFHRFRDLVEQSFRRWHHVGPHANTLGCTEKTLTRAALAVVGTSAKAFIAGRVALEAKRLLVHTTLQVGVIAVDLGFQDASNFVKFFKRESGATPLQFRVGCERA